MGRAGCGSVASKMKTLSVLLLLAVAGCGLFPTQQQDVVTKIETVEVPKPVPVRCLSPSEIPAIPRTNMNSGPDLRKNPNATIRDYMLALDRSEKQRHADIDDLLAVTLRMEALLRGCASKQDAASVAKEPESAPPPSAPHAPSPSAPGARPKPVPVGKDK